MKVKNSPRRSSCHGTECANECINDLLHAINAHIKQDEIITFDYDEVEGVECYIIRCNYKNDIFTAYSIDNVKTYLQGFLFGVLGLQKWSRAIKFIY